MLDAGVHLSDKCTLLMKTHRPFQTQYNIFYRIQQMVKKQQILLFLKCFQILSCLVSDRSNVMNKSNTFLMKGEKIFLKKIFLLSMYKENRAVFPFHRKNLMTIIQNISES
jgi:hypothetical protein